MSWGWRSREAGRGWDADAVGEAAGVVRGEVYPWEGRLGGLGEGSHHEPFRQLIQGRACASV